MATPNMMVVLQGILTTTNNLVSPAPYIGNFDLQNPTLNATAVFQDPYFQALESGSSVPLPLAKIFALVVQNQSATDNLIVGITPFEGSFDPIALGPGGVFIYFDPTEDGQGISAVTLTGVGATVPAFVLAGA
jgi:hypothetical protein